MSISQVPEQYRLFDPGIDISELRRLEEHLMMTAKKARNTVIACNSRWRIFCDWCEQSGREALPATPETVKLYITWALKKNGSRLYTVRTALSAIADKHRSNRYPSPVDRDVRLYLRTCARHLREEPRGRDALSIKQLLKACDLLGKRPIDVRDRAILLLGFASGWRGDELAGLRLRDVEFNEQGVILTLRASKTDQQGEGRIVGIHYGKTARTCPVRALLKWLDVRGPEHGPLFLRFNAWTMLKAGISRRAICIMVQRRLKAAGVRMKRAGSHSLRAGLITTAVANGVPTLAIMDRTGHHAVSTIKKYVRHANAFRFNPLTGLL
jgi:integrase